MTSTPPPDAPEPSEQPPTDQSAEPASTGAQKKEPGPLARLSKPAKWLLGAVAAAIIGLLLSYGADSIRAQRSEADPLEDTIINPTPEPDGNDNSPTEFGDDGFELLVQDASVLPSDIAQTDDCEGLWEVGRSVAATPIEPAEPAGPTIELKGNAESGMRVVALRAKVTRHTPTADGVLLVCPPELTEGAPQEPLHVSFDFDGVDLNDSDTVPARRDGDPQSGEDGRQFEEGFSIALAKNESIQLLVSTEPAVDDVFWHIEADVVVGGDVKTVRIDNDGEEFHTPGSRSYDDYQEGHSGQLTGQYNGPALDWGVDQESKVDTDGSGQVLRWHAVTFPYTEGMDVYIPHGFGNGVENAYRKVRHDGRTLLLFNPPEIDALDIEVVEGALCMVGDIPGSIESVGPVVTQTVKHGSADFEHHTIDYACVSAGGAKQAYRRESAQRVGSPILFRTELDPAASDEDRVLARDILRSLQDQSE